MSEKLRILEDARGSGYLVVTGDKTLTVIREYEFVTEAQAFLDGITYCKEEEESESRSSVGHLGYSENLKVLPSEEE